jgi:epoxyqueuosine reductase QueG
MKSIDIKQQAKLLGAKLCGIAPIERFNDAPEGFGPLDLFPETKSVIAFAKQVPKSTLHMSSPIPYTVLEHIILEETHRIAFEMMLYIENSGFSAAFVPSEPYEYWDEERKTGKGLVSLKHIAHRCGLGAFGNNHLLYNPKLGSLIKIGAVLTNATLEPDDMLEMKICKDNCKLCESKCPSGALTKDGVYQYKCRGYSQRETAKGDPIYSCNTCRRVCPNLSGFAYEGELSVYL